MATDADFDTTWAFIRDQETGGDPTGALHTDPSDPGGTTKWGISQREYPDLDVADLTEADAKALCYTDYWQASGADQLAMPLAEVVTDTAFLEGVGVAKQLLASSGGDVNTYLAQRAAKLEALAAAKPSEAGFLAGWLQRVDDLAQAIGTAGGVSAGVLVLLAVALALWALAHRPAPARGRRV